MFKYVKDSDYLKTVIDLFVENITKKQNGLKVYFNNGFLEKEEGYKKRIVADAKNILCIDKWDLSNYSFINECVLKIMMHKDNNIVHYQQKIQFKNGIEDRPEHAAKLFYNLYKTNKDRKSYEDLADFFGYKTDVLSYLMFVKEPNRYVPCKKSIFIDRLEFLDIDSEMLKGRMTFDQYLKFNRAIDEVAKIYSDYVEQINLIDAHSFVWYSNRLFNQESQTFDKEKSLEKEKIKLLKTRINQRGYRNRVIARWNGCCSVTGCNCTELLIASHIKPWKDCYENNEWLNPKNGLLLVPNLDTLFDKGYISFDEKGKIIFSKCLDENSIRCFGLNEKMKLRIRPDNEMNEFLEYHRKNILK